MTARASTPEYSCSSCTSLVLRGETLDAPSCSSCSRVVCDGCQLLGLCPSCCSALWTSAADVEDDERTPVSVRGITLPGRRDATSRPGRR